jgi:uncharacterized protein
LLHNRHSNLRHEPIGMRSPNLTLRRSLITTGDVARKVPFSCDDATFDGDEAVASFDLGLGRSPRATDSGGVRLLLSGLCDNAHAHNAWMRVVIPGGTGQVGGVLRRALVERGDEVTVLSRRPERLEDGVRHAVWDGRTVGPWAAELEGADAVVNLAGRSVSCRYTDTNLRQMMDSRVASTRVMGEVISRAERPPRVWLQMSTATIYADARSRPDDLPHDEVNGILGGEESDVPLYWEYSVRIARRWEAAQGEADVPGTRRVALRTAMVMTPDRGGVFEFLLERDDLDGAFIIAAPDPVQQRGLMRSLRRAWGRRYGLPATRLMAEVGALALRTDTELLLKSRRVMPGRLLEAGFAFAHPTWDAAATDLAERTQRLQRKE